MNRHRKDFLKHLKKLNPILEQYRNQRFKMRDLEQDILLLEEQQLKIKKLQAQIGNLEVQIADYQQIVKELSEKIKVLEKYV
jgi:hypothetical protein